MGKKLIISLVVLVLILVVSLSTFFFLNQKEDISKLDVKELRDYTLKQKEVKENLQNQEIVNWGSSPNPASFTKDPFKWVAYPDIYTVMMDNKPSCLEFFEEGDPVRTLELETFSKIVWAIYSLESDELVCVLSYPKEKYED